MQNNENLNGSKEPKGRKKSTPTSVSGTKETGTVSVVNRMIVAPKDYRFAVSAEQYKSVEKAHNDSLKLLDSCANALLGAMEQSVPPPESGRMVGEYTGQNMRQMAKSVCDIIQTKTGVVRSIYQISRDEM